tara:strand:+ start:431 stop:1207 length:777 start_codon:yes stop_codon:yes gene_type:complete
MLNLKYINYEIHDDGIAFINLNRNPVNALNINILNDLDKVLIDIKSNPDCRLVVFRSLQKHFCAGADLSERKSMSKKDVLKFLEKINILFDKIDSLPIPTISSINGAALGGGLELALCCDFRIASESSVVGLTETSLGIIPGAGGIARLVNIIGLSKAKYWVYTAQRFSSENAYNDGVIDFISKDEELLGVTLEVAQEILDNAPIAIKTSKELLNNCIKSKDFNKAQLEAYLKVIDTEDKKEALKAFSEKRKPKWKNR